MEMKNVLLLCIATWTTFVSSGLLVCIFSGKIADMATLRHTAAILMLIGVLLSVVVKGIENMAEYYRTTDYSEIDKAIDKNIKYWMKR